MNYLEANQLLDDSQSGFRKLKSTDDKVTYLAQDIEDAFQEKEKVLATFFDLTKPFDKVWKESVLLKLTRMGIQGKMYNWIQNILTRRHARVKLDGKRSKLVHLQKVVPQGGVISPTLFIIFINDLPNQLSPFIHRVLHADDLAIWTGAEYTTTAAIRLQEATKAVSNWAKNWGVEINKNKTATTLFSLSTTAEKYKILLEDTCLPQNDTLNISGNYV